MQNPLFLIWIATLIQIVDAALLKEISPGSHASLLESQAKPGAVRALSQDEARSKVGDFLLETTSSRLHRWGSLAAGIAPKSDSDVRPSSSLAARASGNLNLDASHAHANQFRLDRASMAALFMIAIAITVLSVVCSCFGSWWDADDAEFRAYDPTLATVEDCDGSWATAYRGAEGQERKAIELLFRCNIISMPEFSDFYCDREYIDDRIQIATQMLQEHSIAEWERRWQDAQKIYDAKVKQLSYTTTATVYEGLPYHASIVDGSGMLRSLDTERTTSQTSLGEPSQEVPRLI
jgi:hypothetical protein